MQFNAEAWLAAYDEYQDFMEYLKELVEDRFDVELDELEVMPCSDGFILVSWSDYINRDSNLVKQPFTQEGIEAGVLEVIAKHCTCSTKGTDNVFLELLKRGLSIDPDSEEKGYDVLFSEFRRENDSNTVLKHTDTYQEAYSWALKQPCKHTDKQVLAMCEKMERQREKERLVDSVIRQ